MYTCGPFGTNCGDTSEQDIDRYTSLGQIMLVCKTMVPFSNTLFTWIAAWNWTDYIRSRNILLLGWIVGLVLAVLPNLVPQRWVLENPGEDVAIYSAILLSLRYLPLAFAITSGLTLGSVKVFAFCPSPLTGAMIVMSAVFGIVVPFAALSMLVQFMGNWLALVGAFFVFSGPALILVSISKFTGTNSYSSPEKLVQKMRIILASKICRFIGLSCLFLWAYLGFTGMVPLPLDNISSMAIEKVLEKLDSLWFVDKIIEFLGGMAYQGVL